MPDGRSVARMHAVLSALGVTATLLVLAACAASAVEPRSVVGFVEHAILPTPSIDSALVALCGALGLAVVGRALQAGLRETRRRKRFLASLGPLQPLRGHADAHLFSDDRPQAFCTGLRRPQIYISSGALALLRVDELAAVVSHERHHQRRRDPLRLFVMRVVSHSLFFLPVLTPLTDRYAALAELEADTAAVSASHGDKRPLARALLAFDEAAHPDVVGIAPERVDSLMGTRSTWAWPAAVLTWTLVALAGLLAFAVRCVEITTNTPLDLSAVGVQFCVSVISAAGLLTIAIGVLASHRVGRG